MSNLRLSYLQKVGGGGGGYIPPGIYASGCGYKERGVVLCWHYRPTLRYKMVITRGLKPLL